MKCGECTFCCTMSVVPELKKGAGEHCVYCNKGCKIYGNHPDSCKEFRCAWLQHDGQFSTEEVYAQYLQLRPDRSGVMFFKKNERIFCGAVSSTKKVTDMAKQQVKSFTNQGFSVVMLKIGERPIVIPANGRDKTQVFKEYLGTIDYGNV